VICYTWAMRESHNDLKFLKNPLLWPGFLLPLKRRVPHGMPETAYMIGAEPVIYHGNMFTASVNDRTEVFPSHEAILAAGWEVD
jgi:hypothetical protein